MAGSAPLRHSPVPEIFPPLACRLLSLFEQRWAPGAPHCLQPYWTRTLGPTFLTYWESRRLPATRLMGGDCRRMSVTTV